MDDKYNRRHFLLEIAMRLSALLPLLALAAAVPLAHAQSDYPSRPVRVIVPFPPGGAADTLARIYGQRMAEDWGKTVVVDNRPGAGGMIGTEARRQGGARRLQPDRGHRRPRGERQPV